LVKDALKGIEVKGTLIKAKSQEIDNWNFEFNKT
jgi:hypothetical protein